MKCIRLSITYLISFNKTFKIWTLYSCNKNSLTVIETKKGKKIKSLSTIS